MSKNSQPVNRAVMATLLQLQSEGLIDLIPNDEGTDLWTVTELGRTFLTLSGDHLASGNPPAVPLYNVGAIAMVTDVVSPAENGKLVVDIGPAIRLKLSKEAAPNDVELGLLNLVLEEPHVLEEAAPLFPGRVRMDIGTARTRQRPKVTKAEFEMVGCSVEFAGLFDLEGDLRCFSPLVQCGDGECRAASWTACPTDQSQDRRF